MFQKIPKCSKRFKNVPKDSRMLQNVSEDSRMFQKIQERSKRFKHVTKDSRMLQKITECSRMFQNVSEDSTMFPEYYRMFLKILKYSWRYVYMYFKNLPQVTLILLNTWHHLLILINEKQSLLIKQIFS